MGIADALLAKSFVPGQSADSVKRGVAVAALQNAALFNASATVAGAAAVCLINRQPQFQQASIAALPSDSTAFVSREALRRAIAEGITTVLSERYQSTDRISLILGIAITFGFDQQALEEWKVISRIDTLVTDGNRQVREQRFIANESRSTSFPSATTGVLVRVRETGRGFGKRVTPNGLFGSVQISGSGGTGPVNGASLGLSWELTPGSQLLVGYTITRRRTLRHDLRASYVKDTLLPLPPGETQDTILGTSTTNGLLLSLAIPVSLGASLGLK